MVTVGILDEFLSLVFNEVESVEVYVIKYKQSSQVMNFVLLIHLSLGW